MQKIYASAITFLLRKNLLPKSLFMIILVTCFVGGFQLNTYSQAYTITWQGLTGNTAAQNVPTGITVVTQYNGVTPSCSTGSNGATTSYSAIIRAAAGYNFTITSIGGTAYASNAGSKSFTLQLTNGSVYQSPATIIGSSSSCGGNTALSPLSVPAAGQTVLSGNQVTITVLRATGGATGGGYSWTRSLTVTGVVSPACTNGTISLTSANNNQTVNQNSPISNITYSVGGGATNATVSGLPSGITGSYSSGTFTISGTTATSGSFPYTVTATGGCSNVTATGTITVNAPPTVTTTTATSISTAFANSGGNVTSDGGSPVTARGVAYGISANPSNSGTFTVDGTGTGVFSSLLDLLQPNTQYFYRAFATNAVSTSYGSEFNFTTLASPPFGPTLSGSTTSSLNVTLLGNDNPSSTTYAIRETASGNYVQANGTLGASAVWQTIAAWGTKTVIGLIPSTTYSFDVKARNIDNIETAFSTATSLATLANVPGSPIVDGATFSTLNVTINQNGNPSTTTYAIFESNSGNFVQLDGSLDATPVWQSAAAWGTQTVNGLASLSTYSFQVVARNPDLIETAYSSITDGTTLGIDTPFLSASPSSNNFGNLCLNSSSIVPITLSGEFLTTDDITLSALDGYSYATNVNGPFSSSLTINQTGGSFSQVIYIRFIPTLVQSYNGNIVASGGGAVNINISVSGNGINTIPTVLSSGVSNIGIDAATVAANISSIGCSAITTYGVEYSTISGFINGTGTSVNGTNLNAGSFSVDLSGLNTGTVYYFHAFATNNGGTAYSAEGTFVTLTPTLSVTPGSTSFINTCLNIASTPNTLTISGANLSTAPVTVAALEGFTYSTDNLSYSPTLSISQPGGAFSQLIYIQFTPTVAQIYNGNIVIGGGGVSNVNAAVNATGINTPASVTTQSSSAITAVSATLSGIFTDFGCSAVSTYGFEYSTTNGFANGSGIQVLSSNLSSNAFSASLTGLAANTTYYYKAIATNNGGTAYGTQQTFTTSILATPVATAATNILSNSFVANWDAVTGATSYRLDVSTSPTFAGTTNATDLFFSEYVEGLSFNKYVEIYNGTGSSVNLSDYKIRLYSNGVTTPTFDVQLSGTLPTGSTIVLKNGSATAYSGAATVNTAVNWNGDDAFDLFKISTNAVVDIFGRIGEDPGTAWTSGGLSTLDRTLVRKSSVTGGVTVNPASGFPTLATQWDGFGTDVVSNLGAHTYNGNGPSFVTGYNNLTVNGTSQLVSGLANNTTYYYRVRGFSTNSTSFNSNTISVSTCLIVPTITGNSSFCTGSSLVLTSTAASSYQWNLNGNPISGETNQIIIVTLAGNYTVTVTNATGCTGTSAIFTVSEASLPETPAASVIQPTCAVATGTITVTFPLVAGNIFSIGGTFQSNPVFTGVAPGTYTLSVQNSFGCQAATPATVTVNPQPSIPAAPIVTGIKNVCPFVGTSTVLTYDATTTGNGNIVYNWLLPPNVILQSGAGTSTIGVTFAPGFTAQANKQIKVTSTNECGTSAQTIFYLLAQFPSTPGVISGPTDACTLLGSSGTYLVASVVGATGYIWSAQPGTTIVPAGPGILGNTVTITFPTTFTTSAVTVQAVNACGTSGTRSISVVRNNPSVPSLISGPTNACEYIAPSGSAATYTVPAVAGITYNWTVPVGAIGLTGQGTNTISFTYPAGFASGTVSVNSTNACGTSSNRNLSITKLNPATPGIIDVVQTNFCGETTTNSRKFRYTLAMMPDNATSVEWTVPTGATFINLTPLSIEVTYPDGTVNGFITVKAISNCGVSTIRQSIVRLPACPAPGFTVRGNTEIHSELQAKEQIEGLSINVFPNPSVSDFKLNIAASKYELVYVRIINLKGNIVKSFKLMPSQIISMGNDLSAGVYIIEAMQGGVVKKTRVVKY